MARLGCMLNHNLIFLHFTCKERGEVIVFVKQEQFTEIASLSP